MFLALWLLNDTRMKRLMLSVLYCYNIIGSQLGYKPMKRIGGNANFLYTCGHLVKLLNINFTTRSK